MSQGYTNVNISQLYLVIFILKVVFSLYCLTHLGVPPSTQPSSKNPWELIINSLFSFIFNIQPIVKSCHFYFHVMS